MQNNDPLVIGGHTFDSRFILGSGKYSLRLIEAAVKDAGAQMITLAVRRANTKEQENILDWLEHTKEHKRVILSQDIQKKEEEQYNRELEQMKIKYIDLFLNTPSYSQEEGKQYFHKMY